MAKPEFLRPMPVLYVKHRGLFSMRELVQAIQKWFVDNNYKFRPSAYKAKADELECEMEGEREITEYLRFKILLHFWARDLKDVEVVQEGEKKKLQEAYINLEITGQIWFDWTKRFKKNKFLVWLEDFYQKYIIRQELGDVYEDDILLKMSKLSDVVKGALGIERLNE